jgi:hypothetical protein
MQKYVLGAIICFLAVLVFAPDGRAQSDTAELTDTSDFQGAYGLSFCFDACGDPEVGEAYRKAILEKFGYCPFSQQARQEFIDQASKQAELITQQLTDYMNEKGQMPDEFCGTKKTCEEQQQSQEYVDFAAQIRRYSDGEIGVEMLLPTPCHEKPGGL